MKTGKGIHPILRIVDFFGKQFLDTTQRVFFLCPTGQTIRFTMFQDLALLVVVELAYCFDHACFNYQAATMQEIYFVRVHRISGVEAE